jgi:hypothetical protein
MNSGINEKYANDFVGLSRKETFNKIYNEKYWITGNTRSGVASQNNHYTAACRTQIPELMKKYNLKNVLDVPCGDCNWIQEIMNHFHVYVGLDISDDLIDDNMRKFASNGRHFCCHDIVESFPDLNNIFSQNIRRDLLISRDMMIHLSNKDVLNVLRNFANSNFDYYLMTNYNKVLANTDLLVSGDYRPINLMRAPFNLPEPIQFFDEVYWYPEDFGRGMGLWTKQQIVDALKHKHTC